MSNYQFEYNDFDIKKPDPSVNDTQSTTGSFSLPGSRYSAKPARKTRQKKPGQSVFALKSLPTGPSTSSFMHGGLMTPQTPSNSAEFDTPSPFEQVSDHHHREDEAHGWISNDWPMQYVNTFYILIITHSVPPLS
jgi:hypothetical protein